MFSWCFLSWLLRDASCATESWFRPRRRGAGAGHTKWIDLFPGNIFFRGATAKFVKDGWGHGHVEKRSRDEAAENRNGHRVKNLLARLAGGEGERNERKPGGERGHRDRHEPFERAAHDHLLIELFPLVPHQVKVMRDHHDRVARRDAGKRDETYQGRDRDLANR